MDDAKFSSRRDKKIIDRQFIAGITNNNDMSPAGTNEKVCL